MTGMDLPEALAEMQLVAILRGVKPGEAEEIGAALFEAGLRIIEVPLNSPEPFRSVEILARRFEGEALIGAGTVMRPDEARAVAESGGRLVVIRNLHEAPADQLEAFAAYLDDPVPETFLLLTAAGIYKRRKFFQKFAQVGEIIEFRRLFDNQLPQFIRERAREAGRTFTVPPPLFRRVTDEEVAAWSARFGSGEGDPRPQP